MLLSDINTKLYIVTENINDENQRQVINKKNLNAIVFNVPENSSNLTKSSLDDCKTDFQIIQQILGAKSKKH